SHTQTAFTTMEHDNFTIVEIERDFGGVHDHLAVSFKISGLVSGNLPNFFTVAHLHATEVLHTLVSLRNYIFSYFFKQSFVVVLYAQGHKQMVHDPADQQHCSQSRDKAYLMTTHTLSTYLSKIPPLSGLRKESLVRKRAKGWRVNKNGNKPFIRSVGAPSPRHPARAGREEVTQAGREERRWRYRSPPV